MVIDRKKGLMFVIKNYLADIEYIFCCEAYVPKF